MSKFVRQTFEITTFRNFTILNGLKVVEERQRAKFDAPVVCRQCNTTWMSELENLVKPVLSQLIATPNKRLVLSNETCLAITSWLTVKAIVTDHMVVAAQSETAYFFSTEQRQNLRTHYVPLANTRAWLARLPLSKDVGAQVQTLYLSDFPSDALRHLRAYVFSVFVNQVARQLLVLNASEPSQRIPATIPFTVTTFPHPWSDYTVRMFPLTRSGGRWPPRRELFGRAFEFFSHRFARPPDF